MINEEVRKAVEVRLKVGENILWAVSADDAYRAESQDITFTDRVWNYVMGTLVLGMVCYHASENLIALSLIHI